MEFGKARFREFELRMKVRLFASLRERIGQKELEISIKDAISVQKLIELLVERFPEVKDLLIQDDKFESFYHILINGKNMLRLEGTNTVLAEDDIIAILPPIGGG